MAGSPRGGATGLGLGLRLGMWVGVVYRVLLWWREGMRVMWLWWRRQWVVAQGMWVWVSTLHGALLIGRWFMMGIIVLVVLVVEAAVPLHGTASSTRVSPARRGMVNLPRCAMMRQWKAGGVRGLPLGRLRRKATWGRGWGSALGSPRWGRHGLTDHRGVGNMGPRSRRGLRQLSTAPTWCTGPRG